MLASSEKHHYTTLGYLSKSLAGLGRESLTDIILRILLIKLLVLELSIMIFFQLRLYRMRSLEAWQERNGRWDTRVKTIRRRRRRFGSERNDDLMCGVVDVNWIIDESP